MGFCFITKVVKIAFFAIIVLRRSTKYSSRDIIKINNRKRSNKDKQNPASSLTKTGLKSGKDEAHTFGSTARLGCPFLFPNITAKFLPRLSTQSARLSSQDLYSQDLYHLLILLCTCWSEYLCRSTIAGLFRAGIFQFNVGLPSDVIASEIQPRFRGL